MELRDLYSKIAPHVVSLKVLKEENGKYYSKGNGTGFLTGDGYLITNFHVMKKLLLGVNAGEEYILQIGCSERKKVTLPITTGSILHPDGKVENKVKKMDFTFGVYDFKPSKIKEWITCYSSDENCNDYIILNSGIQIHPTEPEQKIELDIEGQKLPFCIPSYGGPLIVLEFSQDEEVYIGQKVCIFGYPLGKENLSMNKGTISSIYERCGVKVFQIDGIVNNGNSGGPLIDAKTGKVIGIVTRKEGGLNKMFEQLKEAIERNIEIAHNASQSGDVIVCGISHTEAIEKTFITIRGLIDQIERSANVGIGYAFSVNKIIEDLKVLREENSTPHSK